MIKITLNAYPPPAPVVQKKSNQIEFKDTQNLNDFNSEKEKSSGPKGGQRPPVAAAAAAATTTGAACGGSSCTIIAQGARAGA